MEASEVARQTAKDVKNDFIDPNTRLLRSTFDFQKDCESGSLIRPTIDLSHKTL